VARGASVGRFLVLGTVGAGGMGVVLAAYDPELDRRVALKLLHAGGGDAAARRQLQLEAKAMARLSHPNVVTVFEVGEVDDRVYIAMEFVAGQTLRQWLADETRSQRDVIAMFVAAGRGLAAAHAAGLVHRDFKPDNVLVGADGRVRVADFGVASTMARQLETDDAAERDALAPAELEHGLTLGGRILGTPAYMAPEQHGTAPIDARADQFAFCVALHEGLYGTRPWVGKTYAEIVAQKILGRVAEPPRGSKVPAWLRAVVLRGLSPKPEDRYPSLDALLRALERDPAVARRRIIAAAAAPVLVGAVLWTALASKADAAPSCADASDRLVGAWDGGIRARMQAAFAATGRPFAADAATRAATTLDGYSDRWRAMYTDACRATRERGEQSEALLDLRMACLDRRRSQLTALGEVLARADATVVESSVRAASELPTIEDCSNVAALTSGTPPARGLLVATAARLIDAQLDRIEVLGDVGRRVDAAARITLLVPVADATGYAPVRARAHLLAGLFVIDRIVAERELLVAVKLAGEARDDTLLSRALTDLSYKYRGRDDYRAARVSALAAAAAATRSAHDQLLAEAQISAANATSHLGNVQAALTEAEAALARYEEALEPADPRLASMLTEASNLASAAGQYGLARAWLERALAITTQSYGHSHPDVATALTVLGVVARREGRYRDAADLLQRALVVRETLFGPDSIQVASTSVNLGSALVEVLDLDGAEAVWQRAIRINERVYGRESPNVAELLAGMGRLRLDQNRYEEAQAFMDQALAINLRAFGPDSPKLLTNYDGLGYLAEKRRRFEDARRHALLELDLLAKTRGTDHVDYGDTLVDLAMVDLAANNCRNAERRFMEGLRVLEKALGTESVRLNSPLHGQTECLLEQRRFDDALPVIQRAMLIVEKGELPPSTIGKTRFQLVRAYWGVGDRRQAHAEATKAEQELLADADKSPDAADTLAELRAWRRTHR
jgi:tetratricopeptide (TPR) repeat protein